MAYRLCGADSLHLQGECKTVHAREYLKLSLHFLCSRLDDLQGSSSSHNASCSSNVCCGLLVMSS